MDQIPIGEQFKWVGLGVSAIIQVSRYQIELMKHAVGG